MPPIDPHPRTPDTISVTLPLAPAFHRMVLILFRPFDAYRWLALGFTAWLASLGESGAGGAGSGGRAGNGQGGVWSPPTLHPRTALEQARDYLTENLTWFLPVALLVILAVIALVVLVFWLSSRGRLMFLHNVALNRAEVVAPWHASRPQGNSLFLLRLAAAILSFLAALPFLAINLAMLFTLFDANALLPIPFLSALGSGLILGLITLAYLLFEKLTKDFVVPILWMRHPSATAAWREFAAILRARPGIFALYILFHILLTLAAGILVLAVVLLTCCVAGCLFAIPYLGTVFLLPVFVFFRCYSVLFLAQFGPDYDTFRVAQNSAPASPA